MSMSTVALRRLRRALTAAALLLAPVCGFAPACTDKLHHGRSAAARLGCRARGPPPRRAPITALSFDDPAFTVATAIVGLGLAVSGQSLINSMFTGTAGGSDGLGDFLKDGTGEMGSNYRPSSGPKEETPPPLTWLDRFIPQLDFVEVRRGDDAVGGNGGGSGSGGGGVGEDEGGVGGSVGSQTDERLGQLRTNMEAAQRMGDTGAAEMWRRQLEKGEADASRRRLDRGRLERATTAGEAEGGD